jgi:TolB protein
VQGDNSRSVTLTNGASVVVDFEVICQPSGDGVLLFTSNRSGSYHLYSVREDGTDLRDLTPSFETRSGDWSPDGSRIVFTREGAKGPELFVMDADGSNPRALGVVGARPKWSPDGEKLLFTADGTITVMQVDGTGTRALAEGYDPDWSPDGTRIAFDRIDRSRCIYDLFCPSDLYIMAADGSGVTRLASAANASDELSAPDWSPDGTRIALTRYCCFLGPSETGVYLVSARGGTPQRIYQGSLRSGPVWSPDGSAVAVAVARVDGTTALTVIPTVAGRAVVLAANASSEYPQAWR